MKFIKLNNVKIYTVEISLIVGLFIAALACFLGIICQSEGISDHILRLHIVPNSDSCEDQQLKLKVKDAILCEFNFDDSHNLKETEKQISQSLPYIEKLAQKVVNDEGYNYNVHSEITNMYFDTREYDKFSIPAGKYDALRITIGEAKGHNWWCVLVPSLCVPAAEGTEQKIDETLNKQQKDLVETGSKFDVRFVTIEFWEFIKNLFV